MLNCEKYILKFTKNNAILPEARSARDRYNIYRFFPSWLNHEAEKNEKNRYLYLFSPKMWVQWVHDCFVTLLCGYKCGYKSGYKIATCLATLRPCPGPSKKDNKYNRLPSRLIYSRHKWVNCLNYFRDFKKNEHNRTHAPFDGDRNIDNPLFFRKPP
jgi:hypothetical protein